MSKTIAIGKLKADPENRRRHTTRNKALLKQSLENLGAARSIVIDEHDVVLAGNGVVEQASAAGITKVQVVESDGQTLVAVRRRNLSDDEKRQLAMYDNRTAELAAWNPEQLATDKAAGLELAPFFTDKELGAILSAESLVERRPLEVPRPADIAWVLVAIPLKEWPKHQAAVEAMQTDALFTGITIRGKDEK